ncbi:MAG: heme lyase CcmF/NrfE family subunit, partial [Acidimicrobiia bacterium]|nr:heme lyase CcmF/NrfE family subunit [Acidimicrobiia bacterium]
MSATLGTAGVWLGLFGAIVGVATLGMGLRRRDPRLLQAGRKYTWVILGGAVLAVVAMETALLRHDFSLRYVAENGS